MYDIISKTISRLNGELSTAFVEAAESNAEGGNIDHDEDYDVSKNADSNNVERRTDRSDAILSDFSDEMSAEGSNIYEVRVPFSYPEYEEISSEYSKIGIRP